ncbi:MAG: trypsin-like peptidase domain-containing protein, partial [Nocardiopsaceae bacterium]|nr:trypsin-like peptidase domain-containing protein [Nocardiopsaceae bacterium]
MYEHDSGDTGSQPPYGPPRYGQVWDHGYGAPPPPRRPRTGRFLAYVAVAVLAAGAGAGVALSLNHGSSHDGNSSSSAGPVFGSGRSGPDGNGSGPLDVRSLRAKVDPAVVDVTSQLKYNEATAEGTGMIISSSGLVLTNNHVIDQATSVTATLVDSGRRYTAKVVGYDSADDVAVLQLVGASGLKTVSFGDSGSVQVGDSVLALGNAGGRGGRPSAAKGSIQSLD